MSSNTNLLTHVLAPKNVFVETAYGTAEIMQAVEIEVKQSLRNGCCAFLGDFDSEEM